MDPMTVILLVLMIAMGVYANMIWISVIGGLLFLAYVYGARSGDKEPVPEGEGTPKPKIRPIIVQRKYVGPPSIYPATMSMRVNNNWNTMKAWENAIGGAGSLAAVLLGGGRRTQR